ncbi:MAG: tyrosine-type recombinase/integrase [Solobacterium sp.]|nr:tyrosine-type recombinase/integrase [Solobacterium sp.]
MRKEKYIEARHSTKKGNKDTITAYVVNITYMQNGKRKKYVRNFPLKDYANGNAAKKAAIKERDRMMPLLELKKTEEEIPSYTVDELYAKVPEYFPRKINSLTKNRKVYEKHIKPEFGDKDIHDIHMADVQKTLHHCASYCVQQTVRNVKTDWHRIFQVATILKQGTTDWTTVIDTPQATKVTERSVTEQNITEHEFQSFIEFMKSYGGYIETEEQKIYNRNILVFLLLVMRFTGIRLQEARGLCKKDISFHTDTVTDPKTGMEYEEEYAVINICRSAGSTLTEANTLRTTKTSWSRRQLPVYGDNIEILKEAIAYSHNEILFAKYDGVPFQSTEASDYIGRVNRKYKKVTGSDKEFYSTLMRKSYSSDQYAENVNPATVKKMMGHKYESTSLNWYATASDESVKQAMKNRKFKSENG